MSSDPKITIPKAVADAAEWSPGQEIVLMSKKGSVVIVPVPTRDELFGIARGVDPTGYRDRNDRR